MHTPWPEDFGLIARQRRLDMKVSQSELAEQVGVTRQWLSRFETGKADVSLRKALLVLRELDLEVTIAATHRITGAEISDDEFAISVSQLNAHIASTLEQTKRVPGMSATARAAVEKLMLDPSQRQSLEILHRAQDPRQ